jgi:hypothetical protein
VGRVSAVTVPEAGGLEGRYSDPNHPVGFRTLVLSQDDPGMVVIAGTCSGEYVCHASEIQTGWSPRSERPFER